MGLLRFMKLIPAVPPSAATIVQLVKSAPNRRRDTLPIGIKFANRGEDLLEFSVDGHAMVPWEATRGSDRACPGHPGNIGKATAAAEDMIASPVLKAFCGTDRLAHKSRLRSAKRLRNLSSKVKQALQTTAAAIRTPNALRAVRQRLAL